MLERLFFFNLEISLSISFLFLFLFLISKIFRLRYTANCRAKIFFVMALRLAVPLNVVLPWSFFSLQTPCHFFHREEALHPQQGMAVPVASEVLAGFTFAQLLTALWLTGVCLYGVYRVVQYSSLRHQIERWSDLPERETLELLHRQRSELGLCSPVVLKVSPMAKVPMVMGIRRSVILLPEQHYTSQELEMIFRHELTHVKKRHAAFKLLLLAVGGFHWFNPIVGQMIHKAVRELEFSCDQWVIQGQGREFAQAYAGCILSVAQKSCYTASKVNLLLSSMESSKEFLRQRMDNILACKQQKNGRLLIAAVAVCAVLVSPLFLFRGVDQNQELMQTLSDTNIQSIFLERRIGSVVVRQKCTEQDKALLTQWLNKAQTEPVLLNSPQDSNVRYRIQTEKDQIVIESDGQGYVRINGKVYRQIGRRR